MSHEGGYVTGPAGRHNRDFLQSVADAARENPVSAALIGAGALWLCFGGSLKSLAGAGHVAGATLRGVGSGAAWVGGTAAGAASGVGSGVTAGVGAAAEGLSQLGAAAARATEDAAQAMAAPLSDVAAAAAGTLRSVGVQTPDGASGPGASLGQGAQAPPGSGFVSAGAVQSALGDLFAQQPLALAAVGLAIGAGLAAAFPATAIEHRVLGDTGDALKEQGRTIAADQAELAQKVFREVGEEIDAQGLTPSALVGMVDGVGEKLSATAKTARDAATGSSAT
jgi:hypothetical protein